MSLEISVLGERKGSNPGGECFLPLGYYSGRYYLKYSLKTETHGASFSAANQPVYEAVTAEMARRLGLNTPDFFVLLNEGDSLSFRNPPGVNKPIQGGRKYYFVSKMMNLPTGGDPHEIALLMAEERIYRELLQLADIEGKRHNFTFSDVGGMKRIFYIDVGCSFVHAHEGAIRFHNRARKHFDLLGKHPAKTVRKALDRLDRSLVCLNDGSSLLSLREIAVMPRTLNLPVLDPRDARHPHRRVPLSSLISGEEVEEIVGLLALDMAEELPKYRESGKVLTEVTN